MGVMERSVCPVATGPSVMTVIITVILTPRKNLLLHEIHYHLNMTRFEPLTIRGQPLLSDSLKIF